MSLVARTYTNLALAILFFSSPLSFAQYDGDQEGSLWLGVMILGGFVMLALFGALFALAVFLLRKSRTYPPSSV